jgi:uncharacterized protein with HEPN domain
MGEAAARLSAQFRNAHPEVPWQDIIGMRNRLIHAYYDVDLDVVWQTTTQEVPAVLSLLDIIMAGLESAE